MRLLAAACTAALLTAAPAEAGPRGWARASDAGRDLLFVAALGVPAVQGDWRGDLQAVESVGTAAVTTYALKEAFPERRPDGSDRKSFPSGHTSTSFAAAATLENRYGWRVGLPAFALASVVGVARVQARKHYWHDAAAGAGLGAAAGFLLTGRRSDRVRLVPWAERGGGGVSIAAVFR